VRTFAPSDEQTSDLRERAARGRIRRATLELLDSAGAAGYQSASEADAAIAAGLVDPATFDAGVRDLYRTTEADGVFCYTFFKGVGEKPG
jgi:hypothetical protein